MQNTYKPETPVSEGFFTKNFKIFLIIPCCLIAIALIMTIFGAGLNAGIDFTGGSLLIYDMKGAFEPSDVENALSAVGVNDFQVSETGTGDVRTTCEVRIKDLGEESETFRMAFEEELRKTYADFEFVTIDTVGAVAGRDLIRNAILSCLIVFVCMLVYIAIRFDMYSGVTALVALFHDVLVMVAFMVFFRGLYKVNTSFIAALLTIIGYSINNTIIIFDRIRENNKLLAYKDGSRTKVAEVSVRQTLARTVNTTITTLITLVVLYILGVASIKEFVFPLIVGMLAGVYSSVLLSAQIWARWYDKQIFAPITNLFKRGGKNAAKKA